MIFGRRKKTDNMFLERQSFKQRMDAKISASEGKSRLHVISSEKE